ncbi:hypothetical protein LTR10_020599 [Elasticomyces elasticus]|uniref:Uncharacterized protein n=1 Tax=Exophiala sideris TaxID=1016849 RepID=A0ABR0JPE6_9EURO|nr:hypothetical protein LTR10_020599 [Elasticomyces elasticus]KAK5038372.1 hypothetical protein LTS07_001842 [Exophiala sideris]KAK5044356.1 hypothetical protein LTR13_000712 [Exophiala sideris]KAK5067856.1 hypothetical protein LTR69_001845 [Exophiala sideris]KAK5183902.1 hypothetical protein LTR44_003407 [Eurotiomycetes sp. CCFEE 6388]
MPDRPSVEKDTSIPPPLDPFPTYQTPYPRSDRDSDNQFIRFRRFADEQFQSLFQGFAHSLGMSTRNELQDMMQQKQEFHDEFKRQFEQDMQALRQQIEESRKEFAQATNDTWKSREDAKEPSMDTSPWWSKGRAAKCPALNGEEPQRNASKCPALYDESGQPRTELDAYDLLQKDKNTKDAQVFETSEQSTSNKPSNSWFSSFGWDGKRKERASSEGQEMIKATDAHLARPSTYVMFGSRRMDPFSNTDQTIPWLMLSPYSPIYLCNPARPRLFKVRLQDSAGAPFQISRPRFFERWYSDVDEKMAKAVPWADAFEDLLSLQQTGRMVDRDYSTWRTPSTWIHDMVHRGSLGSGWGFNQDGFLTKMTDTQAIESASSIKDRCRWRKERRWGCQKRADEVQPSEPPPQDHFVEDLIDKATKPLAPFPVFGSIVSAADAIVAAVEETAKALEQASNRPAPEPMDKLEAPTAAEESAPSFSTPSPSSYTYESSFSQVDEAGSSKYVVGTLTSTTERTLPDGSIETKRVSKRRFADGTEEVDESVDVRNIPRAQPAQVQAPNDNGKDKHTQITSSTLNQDLAQGGRPLVLDPEECRGRLDREYHAPDKEQCAPSRAQPMISDADAFVNDNVSEKDNTPEIPERKKDNSERSRRGGWFWT